MNLKTVIDYGCGKGLLADKINGAGIECDKYDPAIEEYEKIPTGVYDLVVCNDVLEHLTTNCYSSTLIKISSLAKRAIFLNISCRPAVHKLPDGRNCHTLVQEPEWWANKTESIFGINGLKIIDSSFNMKNQNLVLVFARN